MKPTVRTIVSAAALAAAIPAAAQTTIVDFEDALAVLGSGTKFPGDPLEDFYANDGLSISWDTNGGSVFLGNGVSNGDNGNFDLEGSNGPAFLATNLLTNGPLVLQFDELVNLTLDWGGGRNTKVFRAEAFRGNTRVFDDDITIVIFANDPDGVWRTQSFDAIDRLVLTDLPDTSTESFAIDNLRFEPAIPEGAFDVADQGAGGVILSAPGSVIPERYNDGGVGAGAGLSVVHPNGSRLSFGPDINTLTPATVSGVRIRGSAENDLITRSTNLVTVLADTDNDGIYETQAIAHPIAVPYTNEPLNVGFFNRLDITLAFPPITAQNWRVLLRNSSLSGARILEIDLLGTLSPDPTADLTRDGTTDVFDLIDFLQKFSAALN